jgi:hypothetical protein
MWRPWGVKPFERTLSLAPPLLAGRNVAGRHWPRLERARGRGKLDLRKRSHDARGSIVSFVRTVIRPSPGGLAL